MKSDYHKKVPIGGELGKELERIWEAIRRNQVQQSADVRVTRTPNGTHAELADPESKNPS